MQAERHGVERRLLLRTFRKGKLRVTVEEVLGHSSYRTAMRRLQRFQATRHGPLELAKAIRQLNA